MVSLVKRKEKEQTRYYLKYSSRENPQQKYLGIKIPKDIDQRITDFELQCYREDKEISIQNIYKNYSKHTRTADKKIVTSENLGFKIIHTNSTQKI